MGTATTAERSPACAVKPTQPASPVSNKNPPGDRPGGFSEILAARLSSLIKRLSSAGGRPGALRAHRARKTRPLTARE